MILESFLQDLRYGARMLYRNAASTRVAVLALAVGIAVNTTVFTAYKAMVARGYDAQDPGRLVNIALTRESGGSEFNFSYPDYLAYRDSVRSLAGLSAFRFARVTISNSGPIMSQQSAIEASGLGKLGVFPAGVSNAEFARVMFVSNNYFEVLGVTARIQGRLALTAEAEVLISENFWIRRFGGDPSIIGRVIHLNGFPVTVVGITPQDFVGTGISTPAFWIPVSLESLLQRNEDWLEDRESQRYRMAGRLAPGISTTQAQSEVNAVAAALREQHNPRSVLAKPASAIVWRGSPFPLPIGSYGGLQLAISLIMAAAGLVLMVACANVGSLQLARARSRQHELCARVSMGASGARILQQLLTESWLLGLLAGGFGLAFSWAFLKIAMVYVAEAVPLEFGTLVFPMQPDAAVFGYVLMASLVAGTISGAAPAVASTKSALLSSARTATAPASNRRLQDILLGTQVALSLVLLITASLLIRSSVQAVRMDTGYETRQVVHVDVQFLETSKHSPEHKSALIRELRARVAGMPGVVSVTSAFAPGVGRFRTAVLASSSQVPALLYYTYVENNYFRTLGIPLRAGGAFEGGSAQDLMTVVVSESAARFLWPGRSPIGERLRLGAIDERSHPASELTANGPEFTVAGVVRDKKIADLGNNDLREIYLKMPDNKVAGHSLLVRTDRDAGPLIAALDPVVSAVDSDLVASHSTLQEMLQRSGPFVVSSLSAVVATAVGLLGLLLALTGIYGTVSYLVVLRTREFGIRMAIGAQRRSVLQLVMRESTRPVVVGLGAGMLLALGASYVLRSILMGINAVDGVSFAGVSVLFLLIALLAALPPAKRAMDIDPMVALRHE